MHSHQDTGDRTSQRRRIDPRIIRAGAVVLLAVHFLLGWLARKVGLLTGDDDSFYVLLGRSLRHLHYREIFQVGTPWHHKYPPVYPALLALWGGIFGESFHALVLLNILASTLALGILYRVVEKRWSPVLGLLVLLPLAVNPYLLFAAGRLYSESVFLLVSLVALWAVSEDEPTRGYVWVAGAAAIAAALTRAAGLTVVVALIAYLALERRWRSAAWLSGVSGVVLGAWLAWTLSAPHRYVGASYAADLVAGTRGRTSLIGTFVRRISRNSLAYLGPIVPWRLPLPTVRGTLVDNMVDSIVALVGLGAGILALWRRWRVAALYLLSTAALLGAWTWAVPRFVVPVLPVIVAAFLLGWMLLASRTASRHGVGAMIALSAVLTVTGAARSTEMVRERQACSSLTLRDPAASRPCISTDQVSYFRALAYVRDHLPTGSVVLTAKPEPFYFYTGRRTVPYFQAIATAPDRFVPFLRSEGGGYVLLGSLRASEIRELLARMEANCDSFRLVRRFPPRTYLFQLKSVDAGSSIDSTQSGGDAETAVAVPDATSRACEAVAESRRLNAGRDFESPE